MNKESIKQVQQLLLALGNSPGDIDGIWGAASQAALDATCEEYGVGISKTETTTAADNNVGSKTDDGWYPDIKHFSREEFKCQCYKENTPPLCNGYPAELQYNMLRVCEDLRLKYGKPARVESGLRCPDWNRRWNGVWNSMHLSGGAADIRVDGVSWYEVLNFLQTHPLVRYAYHIEGSQNCHFEIYK